MEQLKIKDLMKENEPKIITQTINLKILTLNDQNNKILSLTMTDGEQKIRGISLGYAGLRSLKRSYK